MPTDDREQQFERALARHLRNASPDSNCPEAETLAAYHERTLSPDETARWKEHIAGCMRCQEALALVEQSEDVHAEEWQDENVPVAGLAGLAQPAAMRAAPELARQGPGFSSAKAVEPAAIQKARARLRWRWAVPIGALAAGAIVWVGVREVQVQHRNAAETVQMAKNEQASAQLAPPASALRESPKKEAPPAQTMGDLTREQKPVVRVAPKASEAPVPRFRAVPRSPANESALSKQENSGVTANMKSIPPRAPATASPNAARSRDMELTAPPQAVTGVGGGVAGGVPANAPAPEARKALVPSVSETVTVQAEAPAVNTSTAQIAVQDNVATNLLQVAAADRRFIVAPGEKYVWRVGEAGKIERSTDRGKTWKLEKSGVATDLTAGSATSDKICWVIGKAGTILRSTDGGKRWKQIASPIAADLGGIHATDAMHASIWDFPNRNSFETSDGGATWNRISNE